MRRIAVVVSTVLTLLSAACATPGPILTENVGAIRSGVAAARQQSKDSLAEVDELARQQAVERKLLSSDQILRQEDFPPAIPAASAAQWDEAFDILDQYGAALQSLVDPKHAQATGDAIGSLGRAINESTVLKTQIPGPLTAIFQTFGAALVQARAESSATSVMRSTNAAFNEVVGGMATSIGSSDEPGSVANSAWSQWENAVLPRLEEEYRTAVRAGNKDRQRQVVESYVTAMGERDKQLTNLLLLKRSLLALGEAHTAAAEGKPGDALFWIGRINGWADDVRKRIKESEEAAKKEGEGG